MITNHISGSWKNGPQWLLNITRMRAWFGLLPTVDMDSGFIFTVFLTSGLALCGSRCSAHQCLGKRGIFAFFRARTYGTVRSVSWCRGPKLAPAQSILATLSLKSENKLMKSRDALSHFRAIFPRPPLEPFHPPPPFLLPLQHHRLLLNNDGSSSLRVLTQDQIGCPWSNLRTSAVEVLLLHPELYGPSLLHVPHLV